MILVYLVFFDKIKPKGDRQSEWLGTFAALEVIVECLLLSVLITKLFIN